MQPGQPAGRQPRCMTLAPSARSASACGARACDADAARRSSASRCRARPACPRPCRARRSRCSTRTPRGRSSTRPRSRARARRSPSASGCSLPWSMLAARRSTSSSAVARGSDDAIDRRLAFGQRAGLVDDERVDLSEVLDRRGIAEQDALRRRLAGRDHDRHRRRQSERAGAGDDQHRDGVDQAVDPARLRVRTSPRRRTSATAMPITATTK